MGARQAARTLMDVADAAAASDPSPRPSAPTAPTAPSRPAAKSQPARSALPSVPTARRGIAEGGKRFGEAVWGPFVHLGGVLWLEFTGVFFGIFALVALQGFWSLRSALHAGASAHNRHRLMIDIGVGLLFSYFCISSFLRARRRGRNANRR
jgi:hypothetical protein